MVPPSSPSVLRCLQTFVKGVPPRQKLLPTGGAVLTTEEAYMALVDRCFPDEPGEQLHRSDRMILIGRIRREGVCVLSQV